jgi:hypothetical protein
MNVPIRRRGNIEAVNLQAWLDFISLFFTFLDKPNVKSNRVLKVGFSARLGSYISIPPLTG